MCVCVCVWVGGCVLTHLLTHSLARTHTHTVVLWCDLLGDIHTGEDSLPSSGPSHTPEDVERGTSSGAPRQPGLHP